MRATRLLVRGLVAMAAGLAVLPAPAGAAVALQVTTPYPAVTVEPGATTTFDLSVTARGRQRVDLAVTTKPRGWTATLRGGGFVVDGVFTDPRNPPEVRLEVEVPQDVRPGTYRVVVTGRSAVGSDALELTLRVAREVGGGVQLSAEFPRLRGPSDATFQFDLDLSNDTPREITFNLEAAGPPGWQMEARPSGQQRAATVTVEAGGTESITVEADPPDDTPAGTYRVGVRAVGGGQSAELPLEVDITGNFAMTVTTPDERLNVDAQAGRPTEVPLVVRNDGTAPLTEVSLSATPPSGWEVRFRPDTIAQIAPGQAARTTATIVPAEDAVAGDYIVTIRASVPETDHSVDIRTTVKTSGTWGVVGLALIALAIGGLGWVFRRYGRR